MLYFCFAGIVGDLELSRSPRVSIAQGVGTVGFTDGSLLQCVAKLHEIIGTGLMNLLLILIFQVGVVLLCFCEGFRGV